jgi:hypothetical protein
MGGQQECSDGRNVRMVDDWLAKMEFADPQAGDGSFGNIASNSAEREPVRGFLASQMHRKS